jgi:3-deoxy-D-manno-octulosonate 8-phosphate phosphatase (KDO 8-P phosphatase)
MQRAAFACAPSNAHVEVKAVADYHAVWVTSAARELCDLLLVASGQYADLWRSYLA